MSITEQASLYRRWNPEKLEDVVGNTIAKAKCKTLISDTPPSRRPGFYLFTGGFGTGKSTLAHILFGQFGCGDIRVFNSRDCGKVDFVSQFLAETLPSASLLSSRRAFIFEEAHNITVGAQEMFLEPLEKGLPLGTYVAFVTNYPEKLTAGKGALLSRPYRIDTSPVTVAEMLPRLRHINLNEPCGLSEDELSVCATAANKSVRVAINNMSRLATLPADLRPKEIERIRLEGETSASEIPPNLKELAVALESRSWDSVAAVLLRLREDGEDPEGLRRGLLAWFSGILMSPKPFCKPKRKFARLCIDSLRDNYYNTGFAGLCGDLSHIAETGI